MKEIVVAVDGSEAANHAARFARDLGGETQAQVTLLYVYDAPAAAMLGFGALTPEQLDASKASVAKGSFEKAKAAIGSTPVEVKTEVVIGHPGTEIVAYAKSKKADLIIMGSRGLSPVAEMLMGSVSEHVVRHAHCPVTIVR